MKRISLIVGLIFLVLIVVTLNGCSEKEKESVEVKDVKTYSNFGFSFEYPEYMNGIEELGLLEEKPTDASGSIYVFRYSLAYDTYSDEVGVIWIKNALYQPERLENILEDAVNGMKVEVEPPIELEFMNLVESKKDNNRLLYRQFSMKLEDKNVDGVTGVWYSEKSKRVYSISITKEEGRALELFGKTLNSFKEE